MAVNNQAEAADNSSGIGIILGSPTGISFKFLDKGPSHFNSALGWSFKKETDIYIHTDYIFNRFKPIRFSRNFYMIPTMGIGGRLETKDGNLAVRAPFGLSYDFIENPFDIFIEIVPTLDLIPATDFEVRAALAVRYLF
jgi:hypothetical protein